MPGDFIRDLQRRNPEFFHRILRFNLPESGDFVRERLPAEASALLGSGTLARLEASRAGRREVRRYLRAAAGCPPEAFFLDFRPEHFRLALLGSKLLEELLLTFGGSVHAPEAAKIVRREETLALRAALGERYEYVLLRGRFQMENTRALFQRRHPELPLLERMRSAGREALQICLSDWPEALRAKAAPLLPPGLDFTWPQGLGRDKNTFEAVWAEVKKILLREVAPTWQPCFA